MKNYKPTLKEKLRYRFDNTMSKGYMGLIVWLGIISALLILIAGAIVVMLNISPDGTTPYEFIEATWQSMLHSIDSGTVGADNGWTLRIIMLIVTIGGIFIVSTLIGILNNAINSKLEDLRKGKSKVIEHNHTLILGWSNKIFTIINELIIANENQKHPHIVILADKDKVEMDDEIRSKIPDTKNTKIVCRNGSPIDLDDINIVNPYQSKSIIILAPEMENPDIHVIKTILAITNNPARRKDPYHIIAEIQDSENVDIVKLAGGDEITFILYKDFISRLIVQTCRQSGLSIVYTELLDFGGDEIYIKEEPNIIGKSYSQALHHFDKSALIGIRFSDGTIKVNPPMETVFKSGDKAVFVSEDDDTIIFNTKTEFSIADNLIKSKAISAQEVERTLILGWNVGGLTIINEMDNYVSPGSELTVVSEFPIDELNSPELTFKNTKFTYIQESTTDRKILDELNIKNFHHVIVLSYSDILDVQQSDAKTLITLLHLRDIANKHGKPFNIVSEMLDIKNKELASVINADDFIVSHTLVSLLISQLSENKELKAVFDDLFDADGSEIYLKPAINYVELGKEVNFHTIVKAAALNGETAIGYRKNCFASQQDKAYGVVVNPNKFDKITFEEIDKIIVLAED